MKPTLIILLVITTLLPNFALAKKTAPVPSGDSEWDPYGNTCKPDGKCTFSRKETLPGNLSAEVQIVSLGGFQNAVNAVFDFAFSDVRRVAALLDPNNPSSETANVNANAGIGFVKVGPELFQLITAAKKAFLWTDGAFDITATPDIGTFNNIKIKDGLVFLKKPGMKISFDNIIHGYMADLLIRAIYNANIDNALATVGNASRSIGSSVAGNWRTEVTDTDGGYAKRGMTLDITNVSAASMIRGANAPTRDLRWATPPFVPLCRRVTIIARDAAISEALAYGIYVIGPERGLALATTLQNVKAVIVDNNGNFIKSPGI